MSQSYEREQQNNSHLDALASKVSALRGVTIDIYDSARDHAALDETTSRFEALGSSMRASAGRLVRMAQSGNKVAVLKLSAGLVVGVLVLWWVAGWVF